MNQVVKMKSKSEVRDMNLYESRFHHTLMNERQICISDKKNPVFQFPTYIIRRMSISNVGLPVYDKEDKRHSGSQSFIPITYLSKISLKGPLLLSRALPLPCF